MSRGTGAADAPPGVSGERVAARVLGGFELVVGGRPVSRADWQRLSAERLVKLLLVTSGHRITREAAAETLWPDAPPQAGRTNLRKALHFATHALDGSGVVIADVETIGLAGDRLDLDLDRLQDALDLLASSRSPEASRPSRDRPPAGDPDALAAAADVALELGSGELLPDDLYEDWLVGPRERLRTRWLRLALPAARREADQGRTARAHELVARVLDLDPTDEAAHRLAIELFSAEGRHHAARRQYAMCRRALRVGLDADPSPETEEAFARAERTAQPRDQAPPARLVARQLELERIEPLLDRVEGGHLASLVIRGPAGIGKTRLLQEVLAYARGAGWAVIDWQAVEASRSLALAPFSVGLTRLVDPADARSWDEPARSALTTLAPGIGRGSLRFAARPALVTAVVAAVDRIAARGPMLIAIDDLQWLDAASKEVLQAIVSGLADRPVLAAVTFRDDEPGSDAIVRLTDDMRHGQGLLLSLAPLAARDVERLIVEHLGGDGVSAEILRAAHEQSAGNPLFCLELVRRWHDDGRVRVEDGRWIPAAGGLGGALPETVRRLVDRRTADLPPGARELLATAAEMGPAFRFGELSAALSGSAEVQIDAIDTALASGLLVEQGTGYGFAHPLYRLAVRATVGPARRDRMHLRIASALAGVDPTAPPDQLARAAASVGDPLPVAEHALAAAELGESGARSLAVAFGFAAGERARSLFDRANAVALLERSLTAWRGLPGDLASAYPASAACVSLVDLRTHAAEDDAGVARAFRDAVATARNADEVAAAYAAYFWLPYRGGDFDGALGILESGLRCLPSDATTARARLRACVGWCLLRLRRLEDAVEALEDAARTLEASSDRRGAMQALDFLGFTIRLAGRPEEGIDHLERSLRLAWELGDSRGELLVEVHLAAAFTRLGRAAPARPHADRAREVARLMGDRYAESVAAWTAAELEDLAGDLPAAAALRREELRLLAAVGGNPHNEALAHAHLANLAWRLGDAAAAREDWEIAIRLAERSDDHDYAARIRSTFHAQDWWRLET